MVINLQDCICSCKCNKFRMEDSIYCWSCRNQPSKLCSEKVESKSKNLCICGHKWRKHNEDDGCKVKDCLCILVDAKDTGPRVLPAVQEKEIVLYCTCGHQKSLHSEAMNYAGCLITSCNCANYIKGAEVSRYKSVGTGGNTTWGKGYSVTKLCRHAPTKIIELDNEICLWAASRYSIRGDNETEKIELLVNASGMRYDLDKNEFPSMFKGLKKFTSDSALPEIYLDWKDGCAPDVKSGFWKELLVIANRNKIKNILCSCIGGHGRTGTMLASFLLTTGKFTAKEAKEFIWKNYCQEAIETKSQEDYLDKLEKELNESK